MSSNPEEIAGYLPRNFGKVVGKASGNSYKWRVEDSWDVVLPKEDSYDWLEEEWNENWTDDSEEVEGFELSSEELKGSPSYSGLMPFRVDAYQINKVGDGVAEEVLDSAKIFVGAELYGGQDDNRLNVRIVCIQGANTFEDLREDLAEEYSPDIHDSIGEGRFAEYVWEI